MGRTNTGVIEALQATDASQVGADALFPPSIETVERRIAKAWRHGDTNAEEQVAASYARKRPDDSRAWVIWGNVRFRRDDYAGAEEVLKRGLALHPSATPDLGWLLARAVGAQGRSADAKEILEAQVTTFPDSRVPYLGLLELADSGHWDEANHLADETQARTSSGDFAGKYKFAFELVKIPGRRDDAISLLREVVEAIPWQPDPLLILGTVLERAGDRSQTSSSTWHEGSGNARRRLHSRRSSRGILGREGRPEMKQQASGGCSNRPSDILEWSARWRMSLRDEFDTPA
jgi:tetratricopeptide (TPR) repeat protein